ncbi:hypothetical protein Poli38472_005284 [Pythium oligandrum]|uniref:mitogen-activated protein kinase kinase n=1 Tax=Pythium oligandrum TaxID=41045 RepID=A0A8K1CH23_PYTOL|nr:hypothetical protein Poli38472_005284 [Pythium oligandrum]|eukprot:TMW62666.1 hypothetical protein Poli38472_005284 [Pythium oligandrum]
MSAKQSDERLESKLQAPSKIKRRESIDIKVPKQPVAKEEKRSATPTNDAKDAGRPTTRSMTGKESKLKQPEITRPRVTSASPANAAAAKASESSQPMKKVPPPPEKGGFHGMGPGHPVPSRADSKTSMTGTSLHKVRSVQSLANEIRRIRSLRSDPDDAPKPQRKLAKPQQKQTSAQTTPPQQPAEEKKTPTKQPEEKKPTLRSKIKLEIAEPTTIEEQNELNALPGRQETDSPTFRPTSSASPSMGSTGKKGINRNQFTQGLGLNFQLDLQPTEPRLDKSFDLSASGTFDAVDFQIKQTGITRSPTRREDGSNAKPTNAKKHLIKFGVLGRGASGVVHKALHVPSLLLVAVKVIPVFENDKRHQLIAELKALYNNLSTLSDDAADSRKNVACPEIVCLYDAFMNPNEGNVSIVVEYMDGGSLQDIVETGGCKSESVLANISYRVLKGLSFLHSTHQLHRDIKPGNLLINHFGEVKISDFGIVREMENSMAKATTFVGTLTYMSPERIASEEYSYKSDVWSMGLSIMTCALGKFPYASKGGYWELLHMIRNEPPPQLPEGEFSDKFRDFLDKCLKKDQNERWSVKQLLQHDFVKQCESQAAVPRTVDDDDWTHGQDTEHTEDGEAKEQMELDEIVEKVVEYHMKDAKELIEDQGYTLNDIAGWIQQLPVMQKLKLARFADQIGTKRRLIYSKFHSAMTDLLQEIQETYFEDAKDAK